MVGLLHNITINAIQSFLFSVHACAAATYASISQRAYVRGMERPAGSIFTRCVVPLEFLFEDVIMSNPRNPSTHLRCVPLGRICALISFI
jgi:hypothetical protein